MFYYIKQYRFQNLIVLLLITGIAAQGVLSTVFLANVINSLIVKNVYDFLIWFLLDVSGWGIYVVFNRLKDIQIEKVTQNLLNSVREDIIIALERMEYEDFRKNSKEDYCSWLVNDMNQLYDDGFRQYFWAYEGLIGMLFASFALIYLHWLLLLSTLFLSALLFYFPKLFQKRLEEATQSVSLISKQALDTSNDYLAGFEILFHANRRKLFRKKIMASFNLLKESKIKRIETLSMVGALLTGSSIFANMIITALASYLIFLGQISVGAIIISINLSGVIFNYSKNVTNNFITAKATEILFVKYPKKREQKAFEQIGEFSKSIEVKNLSIKRDKGEIKYPDFSIQKGKKYAIVGESGSGKTTLIKILSGEITDYEGQVLIDGQDYKDLDLESLREQISLSAQFPYLFRESLEENLTLGDEIEPEFLEKILERVNIDKSMREKIYYKFDKNLSGGQEERISVARELLRKKAILLMDESTANLDKETALEIEKNILQDKGITVVMITHHLYKEISQELDEIIEI